MTIRLNRLSTLIPALLLPLSLSFSACGDGEAEREDPAVEIEAENTAEGNTNSFNQLPNRDQHNPNMTEPLPGNLTQDTTREDTLRVNPEKRKNDN